jgi:hypothetical protein
VDNGWWIICGVLAFVLLLNLGIALSAMQYRKSKQMPIIGKSISEILTPWKDEDQALEDLHRQIEVLTEKDILENGE